MGAEKKKLEDDKLVILVGTRIFVISLRSITRVFHRKRIFFLSETRQLNSLFKYLSSFSIVLSKFKPNSIQVIIGRDLISLWCWNPEGLFSGYCPISLRSYPRLLVSPSLVYGLSNGGISDKSNALGGLILSGRSYAIINGFDGFRFYLSILLVSNLLPRYKNLPPAAQQAIYPSRYIHKKNLYSRFVNYLIGILGRKKLKGHGLVTAKGRFVLQLLSVYCRKNTDSFW